MTGSEGDRSPCRLWCDPGGRQVSAKCVSPSGSLGASHTPGSGAVRRLRARSKSLGSQRQLLILGPSTQLPSVRAEWTHLLSLPGQPLRSHQPPAAPKQGDALRAPVRPASCSCIDVHTAQPSGRPAPRAPAAARSGGRGTPERADVPEGEGRLSRGHEARAEPPRGKQRSRRRGSCWRVWAGAWTCGPKLALAAVQAFGAPSCPHSGSACACPAPADPPSRGPCPRTSRQDSQAL